MNHVRVEDIPVHDLPFIQNKLSRIKGTRLFVQDVDCSLGVTAKLGVGVSGLRQLLVRHSIPASTAAEPSALGQHG